GDVIVTPGLAGASIIGGRLGLDGGPHHFNVSGHTVIAAHGIECTVTAEISESTPGASLEKDGAGVLRVTGASTYTGPTLVANGTMQVDGTQPQSPVRVSDGARLLGSGMIGPVDYTGSSGEVEAGSGPGILSCGNFSANATGNGTFTIQ